MRGASVALALMAPAPVAFGVQAVRRLSGPDPSGGWALAAAGGMALAGLVVLVLTQWRRDFHWRGWIAGFLVLVGHGYLASRGLPELGAAFTYIGLGVAGSLRGPPPLKAGFACAVAAIVRWASPNVGDAMLAVAAPALGVLLLLAATTRPPPA